MSGPEVSIGAATFRVTRVLISRPDQGGSFADLAPSLIMNAADLPATQLIQPGSRVSYSQLFAGERARIEAFKSWLAVNKAPRRGFATSATPARRSRIRWIAPPASSACASLVSVLLCAIAVAMSARRYVQRHLDAVALMKTLGATRALIFGISALQLLAIAVVAATHRLDRRVPGAELASVVVSSLLNTELPPPASLPSP